MVSMVSNHFISGNEAHRSKTDKQTDGNRQKHKRTKITNELICS